MKAHRKTRSDSFWDGLPPDQKAEIYAWTATHSLAHCVQRAREKWGYTQGSAASLSNWRAKFAQEQLERTILQRITDGSAAARQAEDFLAKNPAPALDTIIKLQRVLIMDLSARGAVDPATLGIIQKMVGTCLDHQRAGIAQDSLNLDRARFQRETAELFLKWQADARAQEITASTSSNSEKIEALGNLMFGDLWAEAKAAAAKS